MPEESPPMKTSWIAVSACLLVTACVSSGPESRLGTQEESPRRIQMSRTSDCVFQRNVEDFEAIDDRYVVLYASGRRKAYLAEIAGACFDIRNRNTLAAVDGDRNGQICGFGRDSLAYQNLGMVENCRILGLEDLSDERRIELGLGGPQPKPRKEPKDGQPESTVKDDGPRVTPGLESASHRTHVRLDRCNPTE
jgi:hypothetical protein